MSPLPVVFRTKDGWELLSQRNSAISSAEKLLVMDTCEIPIIQVSRMSPLPVVFRTKDGLNFCLREIVLSVVRKTTGNGHM